MAQSQLMDALEADRDVPETVRCFASLGAFGAHTHNEERDLHRWLKNLHQISLEPYYIKLEVEVGASEIVFLFVAMCMLTFTLRPFVAQLQVYGQLR